MIPLSAGGVFRQYGDGRFCEGHTRDGAPAIHHSSISLSSPHRQDACIEGNSRGRERLFRTLPHTGSQSELPKSKLLFINEGILCTKFVVTVQWLLWSVRLWACPNAGVWLVAVLILISFRPLERQLGAGKFTVRLTLRVSCD